MQNDAILALEVVSIVTLLAILTALRVSYRRAPDGTLFVLFGSLSLYGFYLAWDFDRNGGSGEKNAFQNSPNGERLLQKRFMQALVFDEKAPGGIRHTMEHPTKGETDDMHESSTPLS